MVRGMSEVQRASVSRKIAAPASAIFAMVTDPRVHVEMDGSAMLVSAQDTEPVTKVGDTFGMNMDRESLGDIPLGKYEVLNEVTQIPPPTLFEWSVKGREHPGVGHVYGFELKSLGDSETEVTNYVDWTNILEKWVGVVPFPIVPLHMMEKTLERLEQIVLSRS
jgi:hypothetical protein